MTCKLQQHWIKSNLPIYRYFASKKKQCNLKRISKKSQIIKILVTEQTIIEI